MMEDARKGINAVVTGGGRGFGKAFGAALAGEGAHATLIDLDGDIAESAAADIRASGGLATAYAGDVTEEDRMAEIMADTSAIHGGIDILINNAGLHSHEYSQPIVTMGVAKTRKVFDVNVNGIIICTLTARPHMTNRANASIINIASSAAYIGLHAHAYGVSKMTVAALTVVFAGELGPDNIRVNAIAPGMVLTATIRAELPEAVKDQARAMQFLRRDGEETDIVEAMLFLTSDKARFITGETLRVTGGASAGI
jgi:3-oxoacyl-[acyl-carrier protein] reductase